MKANKLHIGLAVIGLMFVTHSLTVTNADSYTSLDGEHLKASIVESVVDATLTTEQNDTTSDKTNLMKTVLTSESEGIIKTQEVELQTKYQEEKEQAAAEAESQRLAEEEAQRVAASAVYVNKLNNSLKGVLSGYGQYFYDTCQAYGVDPYLAGAISMYETGWGSSTLAVNQNNVGGMRYAGEWLTFGSLERGIEAFIRNIANNYVAYGMTTPATMVNKYAEGSATWVFSVNSIYSIIANS